MIPQGQHDIPHLWSRKPRVSQCNKYRHITYSALAQYVKHHLHSMLLLEKNFVSRISSGKGKGSFKAEFHEALRYGLSSQSSSAFKSVVEDP